MPWRSALGCVARRSCGGPCRSHTHCRAALSFSEVVARLALGRRRVLGSSGAWKLLLGTVGLESRVLGWQHAASAWVLESLEVREYIVLDRKCVKGFGQLGVGHVALVEHPERVC